MLAYYFKEGDILLFRTPDAFGTLTKIATLSKWDHVGLVLYYNDDDYKNEKQRVPRYNFVFCVTTILD